VPRKPLSEKPMTSAERVRRHRENKKSDLIKEIESHGDTWRRTRLIGYFNLYNEKCDEFKKYKARYPDIRAAGAEIKRLEKKIIELTDHLRDYEDKDGVPYFLTLGNTKHQFSDDELKLLAQVAHPDKHNNSEASVKATTLINKARAMK
jgi:hypothetical protein